MKTKTLTSIQNKVLRSTLSVGAGILIFVGGYSSPTFATPAVFFNNDVAAGKASLISAITSADPNAVIVQIDLNNSSTNSLGITAIPTPSGFVYVKSTYKSLFSGSRGAAENNSTYFNSGTDGYTTWDVPFNANWNNLKNAGYTLEFFSDSNATVSYQMNAIGFRVADWGTCCANQQNALPDGTTSIGSALYIQFGNQPELLIGSISPAQAGAARRVDTFIGAIDDRSSFSSVTLIPNGGGEAFYAGAEFVFSQFPVPQNSVSSSASSVVGANNPSVSQNTVPDIDTAVAAYTTTQLLANQVNPTFVGGTLTVAATGTFSNNFVVQAAGGTVNNAGLDATFSGLFSGAGAMSFAGTGVTTLSGANTYTGATTINSGSTLALSGSGSIATSSLLTNNGTFNISGTTSGASITSLAGSGAVTLGSKTLSITNGSSTFSGAIGGTGGLIISGGTQTLSGVNTFTGNAWVTNGTLKLAGDGSVQSATTVTTLDGGSFDISATTGGATIKNLLGTTSSAVVLGDKTLTIAGSNSTSLYQFSGVISGTGGLTLSDGSAQSFYSENTYTGATTIGIGSYLLLGDSGSIASSSGLTNDGIFDIGDTTSGASIRNLTGSGDVVLGRKTLTIMNGNSGIFSGELFGAGSLIIAGGEQTLLGTHFGYEGAITINEGATLTALANLAGSLVTNNGTLDVFGGPVTIKSLAGSGVVTLGEPAAFSGILPAQELIIQGGNSTFDGLITGQGSLSVYGGTQTLTGANTYSGVTQISEGATLALSGAGSIANSEWVDVSGTFDISATTNGATIRKLNGMSRAGSVVLGSKTLTISNSGTGSEFFDGVISGTGGLILDGNFSQYLYSAQTYTGATTIGRGSTLVLAMDGGVSQSSLITNNGTFDISRGASFSAINSLAGSGAVELGSNVLVVMEGSSTFDGVIRGEGTFYIFGGTQTLTGVHTYTGSTEINDDATLKLSGRGSVAESSILASYGTFDISATTNGATIKNLLGYGSILLGDKTLTIAGGKQEVDYYYAGVLSGAGGLTISGGSRQIFNGVNTYTGGTHIGTGSYVGISDDGSIAASSLLTNDGLFDISEATTGTGITSLAGSGTVDLGEKTLTITNASSTFSGVIGGTGRLVLTGGTQTLTGANTYSGGTTVSGGTLRGTTTSLQGAIVNNATTHFDQATDGTYAGVMSGTGTLRKTGAGVLTLSGANTYSGGTTVSAGTLRGTTTSLQGNLTNNATTQFDQSTSGRYAGNMTGTGTLIKSGSGAVTLGGTVNIGGSSSIVGGTLDVAGTLTTSALRCTGASATSLSGTGRVNGAVTIGTGCTLAPGASPGTITIGGNLTMANGSNFAVEIDGRTYNATGGAGTYDRVVMANAGTTFTAGGTLSPLLRGLTGAANNNFNAAIGDRFTIVSGGTNTGAFSSVLQPASGLPTNTRFDVLYLPTAIDLILTPNSFAALGESDGWTKNAISAAGGYDATRPAAGARTGDSLSLFNLLYQTERSKLGAAFHQMSGQIFTDALQSARFSIENAQNSILETSISDLSMLESGRATWWVDTAARQAEASSDGTALGYKDDMRGISAGIALGGGSQGSHVGLGAAVGRSELVGALGSRADVDVTSVYVFGGRKLSERFSYSVTAGASQYDADTTRELTLANITTRAKGTGSGHATNLGAYLRFSQPVAESSRINVTTGVHAYWFHAHTMTEKFAAADGGLTMASDHWEQRQGVLNAEYVLGQGRVRASIFGELRYEFDKDAVSDQRTIMNTYGARWLASAPAIDRTQTVLGVSLESDIGESSGIRLDLTRAERGNGFSDKGGFLRIYLNR